MSPTNRPPERPTGVRTLTDAKALSALANDSRSRIMDALRVDGPATASHLASRVGLAIGSASHHLKVLHEAQLVELAPELAKDKRERWWRLVDGGTRWTTSDLADDPGAYEAARQAEALGLSRQVERARAWFAEAGTVPEWEDAAFATQSWLHLTPEEMTQLAEELIDLLGRWGSRDLPDDGAEREAVLVFARGFPSQP